ncbi:MAG: alpha-E domain-containing protein [Sediminibacterium sp.]|nr:alpha-E domain-containing protein [Sediminibacterium sp.]MBX9781247.1 alpha-E domain-containing protein [Chitinophagaceae bacterium]
MLSRIADSLYWLQRYMERTDGMLRLLKTSYILSFDKVQAGGMSWQPALEIFTSLAEEKINSLQANESAALEYLILSPHNNNSLRSIITRARENARGVQDQITKEVWEQVNHIYHLVNNHTLSARLNSADAITVLDELIAASDQYIGISDSTMPRGKGWNYMNLGKFTERCLLTVEYVHNFYRRINYSLENEQDIIFWRNLLLALSGYELHLKNYNNQDHNRNVAKQVLFDHYFPRSLYYSLDRANKYLLDITNDNAAEGTDMLKRSFGRVASQVKFADLAAIEQTGLETYLQMIRRELNEFSSLFGKTYFSYA